MAATTPIRRSPRLLARLLSQPATLLQRGSAASTPARKRRLDSGSSTAGDDQHPSKKLKLDSTFLAAVASNADHSLPLHYDQCVCDGSAILVVTNKSFHFHHPAGCISRLRLVLESSGAYRLQVCMYTINHSTL